MRGEIDEFCDEVLARVTIHGPRREISRFKARCLVSEGDEKCLDLESVISTMDFVYEDDGELISDRDRRYARLEHWGTDRQPFHGSAKDVSKHELVLHFSTACDFPSVAFEVMAKQFPALAFDCACVEFNELYAGFGWFNPPAGGEAFTIREGDEDEDSSVILSRLPGEDFDIEAPRDPIQLLRHEVLIAPFRGRLEAVDDTIDHVQRVVVDAHGARLIALPPEVFAWAEGVHRQDQRATDELCHFVFENAPATMSEKTLASVIASISRTGRYSGWSAPA